MIAQGLFHSRPPRLLWPWDSPGKKKYGSGLPCPPPWDSPDPETEPASFMSPTLAVRFFTTGATWGFVSFIHLSWLFLFQIPYMGEIIQYHLSVRLISPSIVPSRSTHVVAKGSISFFFMITQYSILPIDILYLLCLFINGHLPCFHTLTIINNDTMNIGVHISFLVSVFIFFSICPGMKLLDCMVWQFHF